jgi:3-dehydroquinate synthase
MPTVNVKLGKRSYKIEIATGIVDRVGELTRQVVSNQARRAVVITNSTIDSIYGRRISTSLSRAGFSVDRMLIGDGERYKTLKTAEDLLTALIRCRIERSDILVALGGGVVGDVAGFVASTYLRGIRFIQVPTTLLAQIDSSVGGKTGVNHRLGKNLIGAFHQPSLVIIDPEALCSLPIREVRSGLYEAVKYGVIRDRALFKRVSRDMELLRTCDLMSLTHLIARSCAIKAEVVSSDERESGLRKILNFGHTVGHAIEAVTNYRKFLHGEAVGLGMRAASRMSEHLGLLSREDREVIDLTVRSVGAMPTAKTLAVDGIISALYVDKKAQAGKPVFVLPVKIGQVILSPDVPPRIIRSSIRDALR